MKRCMVDAESHCKLYPRCYGCNAFRNPTNADRIRSMSDEELAKFIDDIAQSVADGEYCTAFLNVKNFPYSCEDTKKACVAHVVDWLQHPPKED